MNTVIGEYIEFDLVHPGGMTGTLLARVDDIHHNKFGSRIYKLVGPNLPGGELFVQDQYIQNIRKIDKMEFDLLNA
jgi:hypothetical protein